MKKKIYALMGAVCLLGFSQMSFASPGNGSDSASSSTNSITTTQSYHRGGGGGNSFSLGGQLQYSNYFGGSGIHLMGLGALGELGTDKFAYRLTFVYNFPQNQSVSSSTVAAPITPAGQAANPYGVPVTETDKWSTKVMNITFDAKKVFGDYSDGGFYLFAGLGLSLASEGATVSYSNYDQTNYAAPSSSVSSQSFSQWYIRLGAGYDLKVGNGKLFGEAALDLAANQANGQAIEVQIPSFLHIAAGYRFSLGR